MQHWTEQEWTANDYDDELGLPRGDKGDEVIPFYANGVQGHEMSMSFWHMMGERVQFQYRVTGEPFEYYDAIFLFKYEKLTGELTWRQRDDDKKFTSVHAGKKAWKRGKCGTHLVVHYKKTYTRARITWLLMTGQWPTGYVRFHDGDKENFSWDNLYMKPKRRLQSRSKREEITFI